MKLPTVYASAYVESRATVQWDEESFTVSCQIEYLPHASPPESTSSLGETIDRQLRIASPTYVISGGTFSMLLDSEKRIKEFDFYTNPAQWSQCAWPVVDAIPGIPSVETQFDKNGQGESMGEPDAFYESSRGTLYLKWCDASTWHAIAPAVALGVMSDNSLAQIRVEGLFMDKAVERAGRSWTGILRRLGARN